MDRVRRLHRSRHVLATAAGLTTTVLLVVTVCVEVTVWDFAGESLPDDADDDESTSAPTVADVRLWRRRCEGDVS